jgi:hypothetical protein
MALCRFDDRWYALCMSATSLSVPDDLRRFVTTLARHKVDFVICGSFACMVLGVATTYVVSSFCAWHEDCAGLDMGTPGGIGQRYGSRLTDVTGTEVVPARYGDSLPGTMHLRFCSYERHGVTVADADLLPHRTFTPAGPEPPKSPRPEDAARSWENRWALPWLCGLRPWPEPLHDRSLVKAAGWPFRASA